MARSLLIAFAFLFSSLTVSTTATAQSAAASLGCKDPAIRSQAEEIKQHYIKQGFEVFRDAMVGMDSQIPYPIIAELHRADLYLIVFVGNANAQRMKLEVLDGADNIIESRVALKDQPNYHIYTLVPGRTDAYLFNLTQRMKKDKETCGSFSILRMVKKQSEVVPYTGVRPAPVQ